MLACCCLLCVVRCLRLRFGDCCCFLFCFCVLVVVCGLFVVRRLKSVVRCRLSFFFDV